MKSYADSSSLRAKRSNPYFLCGGHGLLRFARNDGADDTPHPYPSSPANGSAEWPPDDRLRRAIQYSEASMMESQSCGELNTAFAGYDGHREARTTTDWVRQ